MVVSILVDILFAMSFALAIICALTYSFYCLFLSDGNNAFSLQAFLDGMKNFTERDNDEHRSDDKRSG